MLSLLLTSFLLHSSLVFSFHAPSTSDIYTLSLHDALPISSKSLRSAASSARVWAAIPTLSMPPVSRTIWGIHRSATTGKRRSEEHTSELQSRFDLVCRLLLEKKKQQHKLGCASESDRDSKI